MIRYGRRKYDEGVDRRARPTTFEPAWATEEGAWTCETSNRALLGAAGLDLRTRNRALLRAAG